MKKIILLVVILVLAVVIIVVKQIRTIQDVEPIVWYGMMPHPYISEVCSGVEACEKDMGVSICKVVGQDWSQDNENVNIEALSTKGHKAFSVYPGDPAGANGLFNQLKRRGQFVVAYGAQPNLPTPASFTVATDSRIETALSHGIIGNLGRLFETIEGIKLKIILN